MKISRQISNQIVAKVLFLNYGLETGKITDFSILEITEEYGITEVEMKPVYPVTWVNQTIVLPEVIK